MFVCLFIFVYGCLCHNSRYYYFQENERNKYKLIVVGHSLGAGAAAILAIILRDKYPDLFCYAFSPPGATLSYDAAKYAEKFVLSIVVGKDMIPR